MYLYKKILVGLDLSQLDKALIDFTSEFARINKTQEIIFVNIIRSLQIPDEVLQEFPDLKEKAVGDRLQKMEAAVRENLASDLNVSIRFDVKYGNTAKKILKIAEEEDIDLIVLGNKTTLKGSGVAVQRVARRAGCSFLILPEEVIPVLKKILVPSDFSDYSTIALEEAVLIAENFGPDVRILIQNVFSVPVGYHYTGKNYDEFAEVMRKHAEKDFDAFIKPIDTKGVSIRTEYTLDEDDDPVEDIYEQALKSEADLIVIGAKGRTATTAIFLGSMAERLIQVNTKIPLLVVRPKGKTAGILDYLKEL